MNTKELVIQLSPELTKAEIADVLDISRQRVQLVLGTATGDRKASDLYRDLVQSGAWDQLNDLRVWNGDGGQTQTVAEAIISAIQAAHRIMAEYQDGGQIYILKTKVAPDCKVTIATEGDPAHLDKLDDQAAQP